MFKMLVIVVACLSFSLPSHAAKKSKITLKEINSDKYKDMDLTEEFTSDQGDYQPYPFSNLVHPTAATKEVKDKSKEKNTSDEKTSVGKSTDLFSAKASLQSPKTEQKKDAAVEKKSADLKTEIAKAFPIAGRAYFIAGLGVARSGGRRHAGVDWGASTGTPVAAAWSGTVTKAYYDKLGGWAVKIKHPNGLTTYYAHLRSKPDVRSGQKVKAGEIVGLVGASGNAKGTVPHLHFEVRRNGQILNPLTYFSKANIVKEKKSK